MPLSLDEVQTALKPAKAQHCSRPAETSSQVASDAAEVVATPLVARAMQNLPSLALMQPEHGSSSSNAELAKFGTDAEPVNGVTDAELSNAPARRNVTFCEQEAEMISRPVTIESDFEFVDCRKVGAINQPHDQVAALNAVSDECHDTKEAEQCGAALCRDEAGKELLAMVPIRRHRELACC